MVFGPRAALPSSLGPGRSLGAAAGGASEERRRKALEAVEVVHLLGVLSWLLLTPPLPSPGFSLAGLVAGKRRTVRARGAATGRGGRGGEGGRRGAAEMGGGAGDAASNRRASSRRGAGARWADREEDKAEAAGLTTARW